MNSDPEQQRYATDWPYFSVSDVALEGRQRHSADLLRLRRRSRHVGGLVQVRRGQRRRDLPFHQMDARQAGVGGGVRRSAHSKPPPARPAGRATASPAGSGLQEAQAARRERSELGSSINTTGGSSVSRISDLLSRSDLQLSDEDREVLLAEERRLAGFEESETQRRERERRAEVVAYCGSPDGTVEGLLDKIGLGDPGVKKYVSNALLSDDGGPAIELSEHLSDGRRPTASPRQPPSCSRASSTSCPSAMTARSPSPSRLGRIPDDPKPPAEKDKKPKTTQGVGRRSPRGVPEQGLGAS
jgi:hypothetical protein